MLTGYLDDGIIVTRKGEEMKQKKYHCGMVVGRFEPIHIGHEHLIRIANQLCDQTVVVITYGKKDSKNPYPIDYIDYLIHKVYAKEIQEGKIKTILFENNIPFDQKYGEKLMMEVTKKTSIKPDLIVYGSDKNIEQCFSEEVRENLDEMRIDRKKIDISATKVRNALIDHEISLVKQYINPKIYDEIETLQEKVLLK